MFRTRHVSEGIAQVRRVQPALFNITCYLGFPLRMISETGPRASKVGNCFFPVVLEGLRNRILLGKVRDKS
jgi:hypothetical protein